MAFDEEDQSFETDLILEICLASKEAEEFEKILPDCSILVEQVPLWAIRAWLNNDSGVESPRNLWCVVFEAFDQEKISFLVDPLQKKVIDVKSRKIEPDRNGEFDDEYEEDIDNISSIEDEVIQMTADLIEVKEFEDKHSEITRGGYKYSHCWWTVGMIKASAIEKWIKKFPILQKVPPQNLCMIKIDTLEPERLTLILDPFSKKLLVHTIDQIEKASSSSFENDDTAIEIAMNSDLGKSFQNKHPDCVWTFENLNDTGKYDWIKTHFASRMAETWGAIPEDLHIVEVEVLEEEKCIFIISVSMGKIFMTQFEKLEPEPVEVEEEEPEEGEESEIITSDEEEAVLKEVPEFGNEEDLSFETDLGVDICLASKEAKNFDNFHRDCSILVDQVPIWVIQAWLNKKVGSESALNLWVVDFEAIEQEKLSFIVDLLQKKVINVKSRKLEPDWNEEFEEKEEEEEEEGDEEDREKIISTEDEIISITYELLEVKEFINKYFGTLGGISKDPCWWTVNQIDPSAIEDWIKKYPVLRGKSPENLWMVEIEGSEQARLTVILDLISRKPLACITEQLQNDDDAINIAMSSDLGKTFQNKHPDCVWTFENLNDNGKYDWIKTHFASEMVKTWGKLPEDLSLVEVEALEEEKCLFIISLSMRKILLTQLQKLEPEAIEEEDEEEIDLPDE